MNARLALFAAATSLSVLATGCRNNPQPTVPPITPPTTPAPPTADQSARRAAAGHHVGALPATKPTDPDEVHGTADVLAQRAASYAKSMGSMLYKHPVVPQTAPVADARPDAPLDPDAQILAQDAASTISANKPVVVASADEQGNGGVSAGVMSLGARGNPTPASAEDVLSKRLAQQIKDYPQDVADQLDYQLFQLVKGESVPQLPAMEGLNAEDREVLAALLDGISNFRSVVRADNNLLLSRKIKPVLEVADRLRSQAELTIPTMVLCKQVSGFGIYDPMPGCRFAAGKKQPVIVYCEVENFSSQLDDKKMWETRLKRELVLYHEQSGLEVWRDKSNKGIVDQSRNRRHDFFAASMINLPPSLSIGRYLLKVSIEDEQVSRIAENSVPIEIVAQ